MLKVKLFCGSYKFLEKVSLLINYVSLKAFLLGENAGGERCTSSYEGSSVKGSSQQS